MEATKAMVKKLIKSEIKTFEDSQLEKMATLLSLNNSLAKEVDDLKKREAARKQAGL